MGRDIHITAFRGADEKWKEMKAVYEACEKAGVDAPEEVMEYFDYQDPTGKPGLEAPMPVNKFTSNYQVGYEINVSDIPDYASTIRFYMS